MLDKLDTSIEVSLTNVEDFKSDYSSEKGHLPNGVIWPKTHNQCCQIFDL